MSKFFFSFLSLTADDVNDAASTCDYCSSSADAIYAAAKLSIDCPVGVPCIAPFVPIFKPHPNSVTWTNGLLKPIVKRGCKRLHLRQP